MSNYLVNSTDLTNIADAIRAKSGGSSPLEFPTDFVSEIGSISSGGNTLIASGTVTPGADTYWVEFNAGMKMPQKDFLVIFSAENGSVFPHNTTKKVVRFYITVDGEYMSFDFSTDGEKSVNYSQMVEYRTNNNDVITNFYLYTPPHNFICVNNASLQSNNALNTPAFHITRSNSGFIFGLNSNSNYKVTKNITYDWRLVYFGNNPSSDIVEVSA